ncbi:MAG: SDR family NAD(P)-dependent oxidoreductase [Pseudomonadota bacterium]
MSEAIQAQLKQAIVTIRSLKQQVQALRETARPAIAVVGMGCRLPAGADKPAALWRMLMAGEDAIVEVPPDRWDADAWYDADPDVAGKMNTRWGGFVKDIDHFDPAFFELSAREAAAMDPQQRMLLEVTWEAIEDASIAADSLSGSATGVFIGINGSDYYQMAMSSPSAIDAHAISGGVASVAAGRLSYLLGLNGPAIAIDTACSSSLTAVHLAVQSLRSGESRVALAGGTYAVLQPNLSVGLSRLHMMAPDGRCKTFDAAANGFVQGEGCAMVVLKRLDDAIADGDSIHAVIRGSAINQDGRSSSLTAPSRSAQVAVIKAALADAGMAAARIGYVETHGTGTALGDPIELHALADVLDRKRQTPVVLGALKSNVGHLGPAAGVAGLLKAVLAIKAGVVPPNLHLKRLNPAISLDGLPVVFPAVPTPWPAGEGLRAAGVSAFGFSGTNVHVVLEQAAVQQIAAPAANGPAGWSVFCPSARTEAALADAVQRLINTLDDSASLSAASRTSMFGRRVFEFSAVAIARSPAQAREGLAAAKTVRAAARPRLAMVFGDPRMTAPAAVASSARMLAAAFPRMREVLELAVQTLPSLHGLLQGNTPPSTGPAFFALQWALLVQLRQWGVAPAVFSGHGLGELAAAAAAGLVAWPEALHVVDGCCQPDADMATVLSTLKPLAAAQAAIFVSSQTGQPLDQLTAVYLASLGRVSVKNALSAAALTSLGCTAVLELTGLAFTPSSDDTLLKLGALGEDDPVAEVMLVLGLLHAHGLKPDWRSLLGNGVRSALPLYPFQRARYWRDAPVPEPAAVNASAGANWPPGRRVLSPSRDAQFCLSLSVDRLPWLGDHRVQGLPVVPGAFQLACLLGAWAAVHGGICEVSSLSFAQPLIAPETGALDLWTVLTPEGEARLAAHIAGNWCVYAQARMAAHPDVQTAIVPLAELRQRCTHPVSPAAWRDRLLSLGISIGPAFQGLLSLWEAEDEALGEVLLPAGLANAEGVFHPALLDACLQVAGGALAEHIRNGEAMLPIGIDRQVFYGALEGPLWVHARCIAKGDVFSTDIVIASPSGQVRALISGLHVRRVPTGLLQREPALDLFHALQWQPAALVPTPDQTGTRLVIAADVLTGRELVSQLTGNTVLVTTGQPMMEMAPGHWQVPAGELGQLISRLPYVTDVLDIQAWSLTAPPAAGDVCQPALATIQSLLKMAQPPRLWLVTQSAMLEARNPWQAGIWGLGATLALEHPLLDCRRLDADDLASVAAGLSAKTDAEHLSAWRGGVRSVPRLLQSRPGQQAALPFALQGTVLITGGLGGIGREIARWAVARGASQLVLSSRNASGPEAEAFAQSLGVPVQLISADLSQASEVEGIFQALQGLPPLRSVFHTAGLQGEGLLEQMAWPQFDLALAAKLRGAWHLHQCTQSMQLDHFVLFSSIASVFGAAGQGGYAAANAGLDALANHRRASGLPALSIAWGRWAGAGMAEVVTGNLRRRIDSLGVLPMAPGLALAALEIAMGSGLSDPLIAAMDWAQYRSQYPAANVPRLLQDLGGKKPSYQAENTAARIENLLLLVPAERSAALLELLGEQFGRALGQQPGQLLDTARPLVQLGMDSLMAMEVRNRIQRDFGYTSSIGDLLGGACLREIAAGLDSFLSQQALEKAPAAYPAEEEEQWEEFKL